MAQDHNITPCRLAYHPDGSISLLLVAYIDEVQDQIDGVFAEFDREPNGYAWTEAIRTVIPAEIQSSLKFDPEADMVSIVGHDETVLVNIAHQIQHLIQDMGALRAALEKAELD